MKKNIIDRLEELKETSSFNNSRDRSFIDRVIYRVENKLPINYKLKSEDKRQRIIEIVKNFDNKSKNTQYKKKEQKDNKKDNKEIEKGIEENDERADDNLKKETL